MLFWAVFKVQVALAKLGYWGFQRVILVINRYLGGSKALLVNFAKGKEFREHKGSIRRIGDLKDRLLLLDR